MSEVRETAKARLKDIQAQMYVLGEEAKAITSYLFNSDREDKEHTWREEQLKKEADEKERQATVDEARTVTAGE